MCKRVILSLNSPRKLRGDFHRSADERLAEAMLHASVEFRIVIEFGKHGNGILRVWIFRVSGVEFVQRHEIHFAGEPSLVDLCCFVKYQLTPSYFLIKFSL